MGDGDDKNSKMTEDDKKRLEAFEKEFEKNKDNLANGPVSNRSTTDIPCCLIFIVFLVGMLGVFGYGMMNGTPKNITIGWDGNDPTNACSLNGTFVDYPFLYFPRAPTTNDYQTLTGSGEWSEKKDILMSIVMSGVCVKTCPKAADTAIDCHAGEFLDALTNDSGNQMCENCICELVDTQGAAEVPFRYDTVQPIWGTGLCLPDFSSLGSDEEEDPNAEPSATDEILDQLKRLWNESEEGNAVDGWLADIRASWQMIAISSATALVFGYLYLWVIRLVGGAIIWVSIIILELSFILGGLYTWYYRDREYTEDQSTYKYLTWTSYGLWGIAALYFLCVCCCYKAIKIGIAVFKTTSQYVQANLRIFLLPIMSYLFIVIFGCCWLVGAVMIFSIGTPVPRDDGFPFLTEIKWEPMIRYMFFYDVFGLFWVNAFILGVCQFIIGASACIWYFECNTDTKGKGTVGRGFYWAYRYHLGSVAFGSFLIAVCKMLRFLFEYYRKKMGVAEKTPIIKALLCLTGYLLWVMEKCVKFISKNAYIQVALTNKWFCTAAWHGFALIIKNLARFGWAKSIGTTFMVFGALMIAGANGCLGYIILTNTDAIVVVSPIPPVVAICIVSILVAHGFLSIFSFSSDAILQSFLLDEELRFAGQNRPEYMQEFAEQLKAQGKGCC